MIRTIEELDEFMKLKPACNDLAGYTDSPFFRHEWLEFCARTLCPPGRLKVVVVESGGSIGAIAPLIVERGILKERVGFIGMPFLVLRSGFLYVNESTLRELLEAVLSVNLPLSFSGLKPGSPETFILDSLVENGGMVCSLKRDLLPSIGIFPARERYQAGSPYDNPDVQPEPESPAGGRAGMSFEVVSPRKYEPKGGLSGLALLACDFRPGRKRPAFLSNARAGSAFSDFARAAAGTSLLKLGVLRIDRTIAAVLVGLEHGRRLWLIGLYRDLKWPKEPVESMLVSGITGYAVRNRLNTIEFAGTDLDFFHRRAPDSRESLEYRISKSLTGVMATIGKDLTKHAADKFLTGVGRYYRNRTSRV